MYRVIYNRKIYNRAKFEFFSLSSLANTERELEVPPPLPHPGITRTKHPGLTIELCVLTGLTAEFPQVAEQTSPRIILTANVDQHADWIFL